MTDPEGTAVATAEPIEPPAVVDPATSMIAVIERAALNPEVDIEKMERLWAMHERIMDRNAEQEFNAAMNEAQAAMGPVAADAENPQTRSKYASYAAMDRMLRPIYTKHGFSLSFDTGEGAPDEYVRVVCYVSHRTGHTRTYHTDMPADGKGAKGGDVMTKTHAAGAGHTYGQRYLLKLIFNVAVGEADTDGNAPDVEIDADLKKILLDLLQKLPNEDTGVFLKHMKIESLDKLPVSRFGEGKKALQERIKRNANVDS